ncbi:MAG: PIN domain-containing protein [Caulobacter sp.]|nr:PIN domain-containing protein [Caulobacter sp.]
MSTTPTTGGTGGTGGTGHAPHLCIDTCSVLDIMRDITRNDANPADRKAALGLMSAMRDGRLKGWVADQVAREFAEHVGDIEQETKKTLDVFRRRFGTANEIAGLFGEPRGIDLSHLDGHEARSRASADEWMTLAGAVAQPAEAASRAFLRVQANTAPSTKGKQSIKDCVVIETYFEHVRALRAAGDIAKVVFLSSNKEDYCDASGRLILRPPLDAEFVTLGMEFWPNFGAAKHALGV